MLQNMLNKNIFLDTNVVVDIIDVQRQNHQSANILIKKLILNNYQIVVSEDMLSTIFYISKDKQKTLEFFKVIQKRWIISAFGNDVLHRGIEISLEKHLDLEDVLQCLCAKENGCKVLITDDNQFYDCGMNIMSINKFLEIIETSI